MVSLQKIAKILGCPHTRHLPITSYAADSRECTKGSIFFALKGERVDGHQYLAEVKDRGAFAAVVSKEYNGSSFGLELLHVEDVLKSLQFLAKTLLEERKTKVIGITGSVGKTTTKEFIATLLEKRFKIHKNRRSRNTQVTFPITVLEAEGDEDFLVLEMGMTHRGNISNLVAIAPPSIVFLGPIVLCHIEFHKDLDSIAEAKCEIFTDKADFAVIHADSAKRKAVLEKCHCPNVIYPTNLGIDSPFSESHLTENFLGACELALHLGVTHYEIAQRAPLLKTIEHRFNKREHEGVVYVDDSYNANPTSSIAALKNLPKPKGKGKRLLVFGSMVELGEYTFASHQQVGRVAVEEIDEIHCFGEDAKPMVTIFEEKGKKARFHTSKNTIQEALKERVEKGDVVLVKGSNGHKLWEVLDHLPEEVVT